MEILEKLLLDLNESLTCAELDPVPIVANISGISLKNYAATEEVLVSSRLLQAEERDKHIAIHQGKIAAHEVRELRMSTTSCAAIFPW